MSTQALPTLHNKVKNFSSTKGEGERGPLGIGRLGMCAVSPVDGVRRRGKRGEEERGLERKKEGERERG